MTEVLTVDQINAQYPNCCVLIVDPEKDEQWRLLRGRVVGAGVDQNSAFKFLDQVPKGHEISIHYTDRPTPNGMLYLL